MKLIDKIPIKYCLMMIACLFVGYFLPHHLDGQNNKVDTSNSGSNNQQIMHDYISGSTADVGTEQTSSNKENFPTDTTDVSLEEIRTANTYQVNVMVTDKLSIAQSHVELLKLVFSTDEVNYKRLSSKDKTQYLIFIKPNINTGFTIEELSELKQDYFEKINTAFNEDGNSGVDSILFFVENEYYGNFLF